MDDTGAVLPVKPPAWPAAIDGYLAAVGATPPRSPRRIGHGLLELGVAVLAASVPVSLAGMNIGLAIAGLGVLLARAPIHRMPGFALGCAFSLWVIATRLIAIAAPGHVDESGLGYAYTWLAVPIAIVGLGRPAVRRIAFALLAVALAASSIVAVLQLAIGWDPRAGLLRIDRAGLRWRQASGLFAGHLTLGAVAAIVLAGFSGLTMRRRRGSAAARLAPVAWAAASIMLVASVSRMAWMAAAGAVATRLLLARRAALAIGALAAAAALALAVLAVFNPVALRAALRGDDGRRVIWAVSASIAADHPLVGIGGQRAFQLEYARRWQAAYADRQDLYVREPTVAHAHSSALALAAEHGIPAAILRLAWWLAIAAAAWRARALDPSAIRAAVAVVATMLIAGLTNDADGHAGYVYAVAISLGLTLAQAAVPERATAGSD